MSSAPARLSPTKLAIFSALSVVLGALEASLRLYYAVRNHASPTVDLHPYWIDDPATGYALRPGYADGGIRINSLGFRGPEVQAVPSAGTYRIVALGDSTTFGPREAECAYPFLLADRLQPRTVELINAGVEGYRSDRALVHLKRDVLPLQPDLVTVFIGWDDLYQVDPFTDAAQEPSPQAGPLQRALAGSATAQTFRRVYYEGLQRLPLASFGLEAAARARLLQTYRPISYADHLRAIIQAIRAHGAKVLLLTWPTLLGEHLSDAEIARVQYPYYTRSLAELQRIYAAYQATLRTVAAETQTPIVDVAAAFDAADRASLFVDTLHFNCRGHALVADELAAFLRGWLAQQTVTPT